MKYLDKLSVMTSGLSLPLLQSIAESEAAAQANNPGSGNNGVVINLAPDQRPEGLGGMGRIGTNGSGVNSPVIDDAEYEEVPTSE